MWQASLAFFITKIISVMTVNFQHTNLLIGDDPLEPVYRIIEELYSLVC